MSEIRQCPCGHTLPEKWPSRYCSTECQLRHGMMRVQAALNRGFANKTKIGKEMALLDAKHALIRAMCGYEPPETGGDAS